MKYFLAAAICVPAIAWGAPQTVTCPATLDVKSSATPTAEWQVFDSPEPHVLDHIGLYSGPPSELASLVPETIRNKKGESQDVWTIPADTQERIWISCIYTGTSVFIAKPIDKGSKRCQVRYKTTPTGTTLSVIDAHCE